METTFVYYVLDEPFRDPDAADALLDRLEADEEITYILNDVDEHRENFKAEGTTKVGFVSDRLNLHVGKHDGNGPHERVEEPIADYPLFFVTDDTVNYEHAGEFAGSDAQQNTEWLVDDVVDWYEWLVDHGVDVKYVFGDGGNRRLTLAHDGPRFTEYQIENDRVGEIFWLQIFPPAMVETIGVDQLTSAPAYRVEELADGGYLLLQRPNPWFDSPANDEYGFDGLLVHLRNLD